MKTFRLLVVVGFALLVAARAHAESPVPAGVASSPHSEGAAASIFQAPRTLNPSRLYSLATHPDPDARIHAAKAIATMRRSQTVRAARVLLNDPSVEVRRALLRSLGSVQSRFWFPIIKDALADDNSQVRADAVKGLMGYSTPDFIVASLPMLEDPSPFVRQVVYLALLSIGPEGLSELIAIETGVRAVSEEHAGEVDVVLRRYAVDHAQEVVAAIDLDQVNGADCKRVTALLASCGQQGASVLLAEMDQGLTQRAFHARRALMGKPRDAVEPITRRLLNVDLDYTKSARITVYLDILNAASDPAALPGLERLILSERPYLRAEAARVLAGINDARTVALLMASVNDPEPNVRAEVATALGTLRAKGAVKPLIRMVAKDGPETIRAIQALGVIGDPAAALVIHRKLSSESPHVRRHACEALERIGHPSSVELLKGRLNDPDAMVRYTASRALASFQ